MVIRLSLSYLGDGGGVIKPIAGNDEEVVWEKKPRGYEGGICRARLPEGWLDWRLIATFSIFSVEAFLTRLPPTHFPTFCVCVVKVGLEDVRLSATSKVLCGRLGWKKLPQAVRICGRLRSRVGGLQCNSTIYCWKVCLECQSFIFWTLVIVF